MNEDNRPLAAPYIRYAFLMGSFGLSAPLLFYPRGLYMGYALAFVGLVSAIQANRIERGAPGVRFALILNIFALLAGLLWFFCILYFYNIINSPTIGPEMTQYMLDLFEQNGLKSADFVRMMQF